MKNIIGAFLAMLVIGYSYFVPHYREYRSCTTNKVLSLPSEISRRVEVFVEKTKPSVSTLSLQTPEGPQSVKVSGDRLIGKNTWQAGQHLFSEDVCLRYEYRQSAGDFLMKGIVGGNFVFQMLTLIILLQVVFLFVWYFGGSRACLVLCMLLCVPRVWFISPDLTGGDDTYHLSGFYREAKNAELSEIKKVVRNFTLNSDYYQLHQTDPLVVQRLKDNPDICPHNLVQRDDRFCWGPRNYYASLVGSSARMLGRVQLSQLIDLVRLYNVLFIFLSGLGIAFLLREMFAVPKSESFVFSSASLLMIYSVLGNAVVITNDYAILFEGIVLIGAIVWSQRFDFKSQILLLVSVGILTFIAIDDRSSWILGLVMFGTVSVSVVKRYPLIRTWKVGLPAITVAAVFFGWIISQLPHDSDKLFAWVSDGEQRKTLANWFYMSMTGSLLAGKWGMPPLQKGLIGLFYCLFVWAGFVKSREHEASSPKLFSYFFFLLALAIPTAVFALGALTVDVNWMSLRFTYPFLAGLLIMLSLSGLKYPKLFLTIALLIQIIAPATLELYVYWQRLNYYP